MWAHCLRVDSWLTHSSYFSNYLLATEHLNIGLTIRKHSCRGCHLGTCSQAYMCTEVRGQPQMSFLWLLPILIQSGVSHWTATLPGRPGWLPSKLEAPSFLGSSLNIIGIRRAHHHADVLHGFWASKLGSSCLLGECFTDKATSQARLECLMHKLRIVWTLDSSPTYSKI